MLHPELRDLLPEGRGAKEGKKRNRPPGKLVEMQAVASAVPQDQQAEQQPERKRGRPAADRRESEAVRSGNENEPLPLHQEPAVVLKPNKRGRPPKAADGAERGGVGRSQPLPQPREERQGRVRPQRQGSGEQQPVVPVQASPVSAAAETTVAVAAPASELPSAIGSGGGGGGGGVTRVRRQQLVSANPTAAIRDPPGLAAVPPLSEGPAEAAVATRTRGLKRQRLSSAEKKDEAAPTPSEGRQRPGLTPAPAVRSAAEYKLMPDLLDPMQYDWEDLFGHTGLQKISGKSEWSGPIELPLADVFRFRPGSANQALVGKEKAVNLAWVRGRPSVEPGIASVKTTSGSLSLSDSLKIRISGGIALTSVGKKALTAGERVRAARLVVEAGGAARLIVYSWKEEGGGDVGVADGGNLELSRGYEGEQGGEGSDGAASGQDGRSGGCSHELFCSSLL